MIYECTTFGSCSSRNIFNSEVNDRYKQYFHINPCIEAVSLVSLMSKPINFDKKLINSDHKYDNICVIHDLSKNYLNYIKNAKIDFLIMDTYFDSLYDILFYNKNSYITNSPRLRKTDFYQLVKSKKVLNPIKNFKEYNKLWVGACKSFFNFLEKNCPNVKIVLNCSRPVSLCYDERGNIFKNIEYEQEIDNTWEVRNIFDKYILNNYDVDVLPFDNNTLANENHFFGSHPTHYEPKYYTEKTQQLCEIINRYNFLDYYHEFNVKYRKLMRESTCSKFDIDQTLLKDNLLVNTGDEFENNRLSINSYIVNSLKKYNTARIDIKNEGSEENHVLIEKASDRNMICEYPSWFKNKYGEGLSIKSQSNFLQFEIKCIGEGNLNISLKSIDARIKNNRIPIYINYKKFKINDKLIFDNDLLVSHDDSYNYKFRVNNGQKVEIYLEWVPYNCNF